MKKKKREYIIYYHKERRKATGKTYNFILLGYGRRKGEFFQT